MEKKKFAGLVLLAVGILMMLTLTGCGTKSIKLNDYLSYEIAGYDGYGEITAIFDETGFTEKLFEYSKKKDYVSDRYYWCFSSYPGEWDQEYDLSNGDIINYEWYVDEDEIQDIKEEYNVNLIVENIELKVDSLEEVPLFDPFEGMEIEVSGYSPKLSADFNTVKYSGLNYRLSSYYGLENGTVVTVSIDDWRYTPEEYIKEFGGIPSRVTCEYLVEGEEAGTFDAFEDVELYVDIFGDLNARSEKYPNIKYYCENAEGLSNGDTVDVIIDDDYCSISFFCGLYGAIPETYKKEIVVHCFDTYITKADDIPEEMDKLIRMQLADVIEARYAANSETSYTAFDVLGYCVLDNKKGASAKDNLLYVIYSLDLHSATSDGEQDVTVYRFLQFKNPIIYADGSCYVDILNYTEPTDVNTTLGDLGLKYMGLGSVDNINTIFITPKKDRYYVDSNVEGIVNYGKDAEDADRFITAISDMPETLIEQIDTQLNYFVTTMYDEDTSRDLLQYEKLGYYLLTNKNQDNRNKNQLYVVYKADIHTSMIGEEEEVTAYKYIKFDNARLYGDGTGYVDLLNYSYPTTGGWFDEGEGFRTELASYAGYRSLEELYNNCIARQKAEYFVDTDIQ